MLQRDQAGWRVGTAEDRPARAMMHHWRSANRWRSVTGTIWRRWTRRIASRDTLARWSPILHWGRRGRRGVAAVEFALTFPAVLYLFCGVTDFGIAYFRQVCLSSAVSAAAQYAELTDQGGSAPSAANVETVMQNAAGQSMPGITVNPNAACYCITGTATTAWNTSSPISCSSTCSGQPTTMKYMQLSLSHTYQAIFPYSMVGRPTLNKTTWIPLKW